MGKLDCGIYPVIPGLSIRLGDYGFWDGPQWCHVGNVEHIPGFPISFSKRQEKNKDKSKYTINDGIGVEIEGGIDASVTNPKLNAGLSLNFKKKNSQYFFGTLTESTAYSSIDMEVEPFLRELLKEGIWKEKYWLAHVIYLSDQFVTLRSRGAGVRVSLNSGLEMETLKSSVNLNAKFNFAPHSIEYLENVGDEPTFAGAKFISLEKRGLIRRELKIKYNVSGDDELSFA